MIPTSNRKKIFTPLKKYLSPPLSFQKITLQEISRPPNLKKCCFAKPVIPNPSMITSSSLVLQKKVLALAIPILMKILTTFKPIFLFSTAKTVYVNLTYRPVTLKAKTVPNLSHPSIKYHPRLISISEIPL